MDIIGQSSEKYRQQLQQDPLANLAASVGLRVNSPEAEQKLRFMGQAVAQQAAQSAQIKQASNVERAMTGWKQSQFAGKV